MTGRVSRLARYVRESYPPKPSLVFAALWAYGVSGLFAALDPGSSGWRPGAGTAAAAVTLFVDLLLMRALDDVRDLEYDRRFHPGRPLASGAVRTGDLAVLYGAGAAAVAGRDAARPAGVRGRGDRGPPAVGPSLRRPPVREPAGQPARTGAAPPVPVRRVSGRVRAAPGATGAVAVAAAVLAAGHAELAGKLTRAPRPGERTYTATLGVTGTAALAIAAAALSAGLLIVWSRAPAGWALVPLIPLVPPAIAAWTLSRGRARRPPAATALYLPLCFASYIVLGLAR